MWQQDRLSFGLNNIFVCSCCHVKHFESNVALLDNNLEGKLLEKFPDCYAECVKQYGTKSSSNFISSIILLSSYFSLAMNLKGSSFLNLNSISLIDFSSRSFSSLTVLTSFRSFVNLNVFITVLWQVKVLLNFRFRRLYLSRCHFTYSLYLFMIFI